MIKMFSRRRRRILLKKLTWFRDLILRRKYEGGGRFEQLPDDVMQLIVQRLSLSDYLNCRHVSRSWRAAIDNKFWLPAAHHRLPRLVTSSGVGRYMQAFCYVKTDEDDDQHWRNASHPKIWRKWTDQACVHCVGSIEGWLIIALYIYMVDKYKFFLWKPVSGARFKLPSQSNRLSVVTVKMVASSVPTSSTTKCYVTCLHFECEEGRLAFCTPSDKAWTVIQNALKFWDIEILDGTLYAIGIEVLEFVMVFDIHLDTRAYTSQMLVTLHPNINSIVDKKNFYPYRRCYLAKCGESKNLFIVLYKNQSNEFEGLMFQVLKLEYNPVTISYQWVEVADLGDRILFLDTVNSNFITCRDKTLEKNCIYFVLSQELVGGGYTSGVFSLTDGSFKPISLPEGHLRSILLNRSTWFTPISSYIITS